MQLLAQFLLRLSFGMAGAMLCVSPRQVSSGYYRNNLYVLLGLNVLASLVARSAPADSAIAFWPPVVAALACYLGAVAWLYEKAGAGLTSLAMVAVSNLTGAWLSQPLPTASDSEIGRALWMLDPICGGFVLGVTMAAMLLGHWYLNAPGMSIVPLTTLVAVMLAAIFLRAIVAGVGLALAQRTGEWFDLSQWLFVAMRWLTGIVGATVVAVMARQTLKIPNTQAATGILYVGVVLTFVGELTAQLLSRGESFPL
jgi:hypothetical protein